MANKFQVKSPQPDWGHPSSPETMTYHGISLKVNNREIGRIQNFQYGGVFTRQITPVRELSVETFGRVVDLVPGINEPYTATLSRVELWNDEFEIALGYGAVWEDLLNQQYPFELEEKIYRWPNVYRLTKLGGCWFSEKGLDGWDSGGDAIMRVNATISFISRSVVQAST